MTYADDRMKSVLYFRFSPEIRRDLVEMRQKFEADFGEGKRLHHELPILRESLRTLVADDSRSFQELADTYLRCVGTEDASERHFRDIWTIVMGDEPWPRSD